MTSAASTLWAKNGHVGTKLERDFVEQRRRQANAPHLERAIDGRRSVGAAAAQTCGDRDALLEMRDERREILTHGVSNGAKGAQNHVAVDLAASQATHGEHVPARVVAEGDGEVVGQADAQEDGRQRVVAVAAALVRPTG